MTVAWAGLEQRGKQQRKGATYRQDLFWITSYSLVWFWQFGVKRWTLLKEVNGSVA